MKNSIRYLFLISILTSIHYSALGNYLVDQDGNRVVIQGHPQLVCHEGIGNIYGSFIKQNGSTIWLGNASRVVRIEKPICDVVSGD